MNQLFELFGEIGVRGANAAEAAIDSVNAKGEGLEGRFVSAGETIESFGNQVADVGGTLSMTLTPAIAGATAALGAFARAKANAADEIAKNAREAGIGAQQYQELEFAIGQLTNLNEREFQRALEKTNQTIAEAQQGSDRYASALERLGFSQEEIAAGSIQSEEAVRRTLNAIKDAETQAEATSIAMDVFGRRAGRKMAPQLRAAEVSVDELARQFREDNLGMSDELLAAGERFNDMLDVQGRRFSAVGNTLAESLLPALEELLPTLVDRLIPILQTGVEVLASIVDFFSALPGPIQTAVVAIAALATAAGPVLFIGGKMIALFGRLVASAGTLITILKAVGAALAAVAAGGLTPIIAVVAAVAAAVAALWAAWEYGPEILEAVGAAYEWLRDLVSRVIESVVNATVGKIQAMWDGLQSILDSIKQGFLAAFQWIYDQTIGRVTAMVNKVISLARKMWDALTRNSIIPDMANEAVDEFEKMADSADSEGERMRRGLEGQASGIDVGEDSSGRGRGGEGAGGPTVVDMRHSTFRDDRDMLDRLRRKGSDMSGAFG